MNYEKYYEARSILKEIIEKDLLGPQSENEVISDYPVMYYLVGKLFPQDCRLVAEKSSSEDIGETDDEQTISLDDGKVPSSMGISFVLAKEAKEIFISIKAALYAVEEIEKAESEETEKKTFWKRQPIELNRVAVKIEDIIAQKTKSFYVDDALKTIITLHKVYPDGSMSITVNLINCNKQSKKETRFWVNQHTYFQPQIEVEGNKYNFLDIRKNKKIATNEESMEMEMLYSLYDNYVTGHGCAAYFKVEDNNIVISTTFLPYYELNQMMPSKQSYRNIFSMRYLSKASKQELISELTEWINNYKKWIDDIDRKKSTIKKEHRSIAKNNIEKCIGTYNTITESIKSLDNEDVFLSFKYANEVMFLQRKQALDSKNVDYTEDTICWYPFQLAFFLQEIISFANPKSAYREKVDLLWFPTGGGKTEAYLGIAAFVIFLRRIRKKDLGAGVSIIMRYTLRLLTFQQFERASAMICACERLRKKYNIPGGEIAIGLWAGRALTPNTIEMAGKILDGIPDPENESSNPMQLTKCPWCGKTLDRENYYCDKRNGRMLIKCDGDDCFNAGLPIYLIDEEIYRYKPSFLVATIDKFAQVPQNEQTFALFGKDSNCYPPELIIQDELHLISGPLGTITGIYEAAFKKMCTYNDIKAKVIASTATIKNAKEQIKSLYGADYSQFPPQGLDADNSYFAVKSTRVEKPARLYMGCMGAGTSATTVMIRVMAATLFASRYLETLGYDDEIIDSFWTITSYFNTLRELGGAIVRVVDNVQDRFAYLKETKFKDSYPIVGGQYRYDNYIELTSREKSENIGRIIQEDLIKPYSREKKQSPIDFILSSNMISVGIDISRLNTMLVVGQPKTTAEYIQATSRVGRETPGFVFTMYNYMRSRDKSHFEQFVPYHEAFYKYVEASSVTPFSERARDRALQTLYIMLCRYYIDILRDNKSAGRYSREITELEEIRKYILDYVSVVDPNEYENVLEELNDIETEWESLASGNQNLVYKSAYYQNEPSLFKNDYDEDSRFRILNSMRSVETSVQVIVREYNGV